MSCSQEMTISFYAVLVRLHWSNMFSWLLQCKKCANELGELQRNKGGLKPKRDLNSKSYKDLLKELGMFSLKKKAKKQQSSSI